MTGGLPSWWRRRTTGERVALAIIAMPLCWLGTVGPFERALNHEQIRRDDAERMLADVQRMAVQIRHMRGRRTQRFESPLPAAIWADAEAAGLMVARVDAEGDDGAILVLDSVRSQPFFAWVAAVEQSHGLIVSRLTVRPNTDATLAVSISLRRLQN